MKLEFAYISTATRFGTVIVRYSGAGRGELQYTLNRPQGLTGGRVCDPDAEWRAFDNAFRKLFGERFEIVSDSGRTLVDVFNPESTMTVRFSKNTVKIDMRDPGIRLDELKGAVRFFCGKDALLHIIEGFTEDDEGERTKTSVPIEFGPQTIWLSSKDPRVEWHQKIPLAWVPVVNRTFQEVDTERTFELGEWHSGPNAIKANYFGLSRISQ